MMREAIPESFSDQSPSLIRLFQAIMTSNIEEIELLLKKSSANINDSLRQRFLISDNFSSKFKDITDCLYQNQQYLIKTKRNYDIGWNYDSNYNIEWNPILFAILRGDLLLVKLLINYGAKLQGKDQDAISFAILNHKDDIAKFMLKEKSNLSLLSKLLCDAAKVDNINIMQFILDSNSNVNVKLALKTAIFNNKDLSIEVLLPYANDYIDISNNLIKAIKNNNLNNNAIALLLKTKLTSEALSFIAKYLVGNNDIAMIKNLLNVQSSVIQKEFWEHIIKELALLDNKEIIDLVLHKYHDITLYLGLKEAALVGNVNTVLYIIEKAETQLNSENFMSLLMAVSIDLNTKMSCYELGFRKLGQLAYDRNTKKEILQILQTEIDNKKLQEPDYPTDTDLLDSSMASAIKSGDTVRLKKLIADAKEKNIPVSLQHLFNLNKSIISFKKLPPVYASVEEANKKMDSYKDEGRAFNEEGHKIYGEILSLLQEKIQHCEHNSSKLMPARRGEGHSH